MSGALRWQAGEAPCVSSSCAGHCTKENHQGGPRAWGSLLLCACLSTGPVRAGELCVGVGLGESQGQMGIQGLRLKAGPDSGRPGQGKDRRLVMGLGGSWTGAFGRGWARGTHWVT